MTPNQEPVRQDRAEAVQECERELQESPHAWRQSEYTYKAGRWHNALITLLCKGVQS